MTLLLRPKRSVRIAVILPIGYSGGSLRGAKLLAEALLIGSRRASEAAEIVFAHTSDSKLYADAEFEDMPKEIRRREFSWKHLDKFSAKRAMTYAGQPEWDPSFDHYASPDDGMKQFLDCDLWVIVSDRLALPLLPIRPYVLMVYDYLQRYVNIMQNKHDYMFLHAAHNAKAIFVTTEFTKSDALNYAGISAERVVKVPMLAPDFSNCVVEFNKESRSDYFIWTTNSALHKNHENALRALTAYYENHQGRLKCLVTGTQSDTLLTGKLPHVATPSAIIQSCRVLQRNLIFSGELATHDYQQKLAKSAFLWHPGKIDNGTFSVVEAAHFGVPALSSNYPAMREINNQYRLNLTWADPTGTVEMAKMLKFMEDNSESLRLQLPGRDGLATQSVEALSSAYWGAIKHSLHPVT